MNAGVKPTRSPTVLLRLSAGLLTILLGSVGQGARPPAPAPAGTILLKELDRARRGETYRHLTLTPDGKTEAEFATPADWPETSGVVWDVLRSPDGKYAALTGGDTRPRKGDGTDPPRYPVYQCTFPQGRGLAQLAGDVTPENWFRDGTTVIAREYLEDSNAIGRFFAIDVSNGRQTRLPIPDAHWLHDRSPDGKSLLSTSDPDGKPAPRRLYLLDRKGQVVRPLTDESMRSVGPAVFVPDGRAVILSAAPRVAKGAGKKDGRTGWRIYRTPVEHPKLELVTDLPDSVLAGTFALSPDGKQIAYARLPRVPVDLNPQKLLDPEAETDEVEYAVVVVGVDGTNPRVIRSMKTRRPFSVQLSVIDWR